jgi:hypothetical protein
MPGKFLSTKLPQKKEKLSNSEESSDSSTGDSTELAASIFPRKVIFELPSLVSHPPNTTMTAPPPFNGGAAPPWCR